MTDITEQARERARHIVASIEDDLEQGQVFKPHVRDAIIKQITYSLSLQPSVTEAIDCVKRLRDEWQIERNKFNSREQYISAFDLETRVRTCGEIIEALESLQGKAGVNELRKWRCNNCWNVNIQQPCAKCGRPEEVAVLPLHAATTPASVEAPQIRAMSDAEMDEINAQLRANLRCSPPLPKQQSPRVCVKCGCSLISMTQATIDCKPHGCKCVFPESK